jgi:hypothetical protein
MQSNWGSSSSSKVCPSAALDSLVMHNMRLWIVLSFLEIENAKWLNDPKIARLIAYNSFLKKMNLDFCCGSCKWSKGDMKILLWSSKLWKTNTWMLA